jgi:hypothetical protein
MMVSQRDCLTGTFHIHTVKHFEHPAYLPGCFLFVYYLFICKNFPPSSIEQPCLKESSEGICSSKEAIPLNPIFKIFHNDEHLSDSIDKLRKNGVNEDDIYMLAHDNDHDRRARKSNDSNKIGVSVTGIGTATKNIFRGKSDKLISKMKEIGFEQSKAQKLEEELDKGKTLLVIKNQDNVEF